MTEPRQPNDPAFEQLLEAYGHRLDPEPSRLDVILGRTLAQADAARPRHRLRLRLAIALSLTTAILASASVAASGPGQPLYGLRLTVEEALVPATGRAHTEAVLSNLEHRIDELAASARAENEAGLQAALGAYRAALDGLTDDQEAAGMNELVLSRLASQAALLREILAMAPDAAHDGLRAAIDEAEAATQMIEDRAPDAPRPGPPTDLPGPGTGPPPNLPVPPIPEPDPPGSAGGRIAILADHHG